MVGNLPRRVVSHTVAENAVLVVAVVANGDVHRAAQSGLRIKVSVTGHLAELTQRVGVGLSALGRRRAADKAVNRGIRQRFARRKLLFALQRIVRRAIRSIVAGLLRHDSGRCIRYGQAHVVELLVQTAITNEDVAVQANGIGERAGINRCALRAAAAVDKADRSRELLPLAIVAAGIKLAVRNAQSLPTVSLVVEVHRNLRARERAVGNIDFAVRVGVDGGCLGYKVAAGQGDVVHARRAADINALNRNTLNGITIGQVHVHGVARVSLTPNAEVIQLISGDGDILIQRYTIGRLFAGIAVKLKGINLEFALAAGDVRVVAVDGEVVSNMAVRHLAHVRARTADDGDIARIGLVSLRQSSRQSSLIAVLLASCPVDILPCPSILVKKLKGVVRAVQSSKCLFQRIERFIANLGHALALRREDRFARNSNRGVLVRVCGLLLIIPEGVAALAALCKAFCLGVSVNRDLSAFGHQRRIDLDCSFARDRRRRDKLRVHDRQVSLCVRALIINEDRLADAIEGAAVERNILRAVSPDVVSVRTRLIERAVIERLVCGIQENHTIDYAVVIDQRVGMLQANVVAVRLIIERNAFEGDLSAVQSNCGGHVKANRLAISGLDREGLIRVGQAAVERVLASADNNDIVVLNRLNCSVE